MSALQNLLRTGLAWLAGQLRANASDTVVYSRGGRSAILQATPGSVVLQLSDGAGQSWVERTDADFLIPAADLAAAAMGDPQRGDTLALTLGTTTYVYEVLPLANEPPWRWSGIVGVEYRVHGKLISPAGGA
jgi:hypothetical protein